MKALIGFLLLAFMGTAAASAAPVSKADQIATVEHLRRNVRMAQVEILAAKASAKVLQTQIDEQALLLKTSQEKLDKANATITAITKDRDTWRTLAHKLLFLASALAGGIAGLVFLNFSARLLVYYPPALPYSALISGGIGILVASSVWVALAHL